MKTNDYAPQVRRLKVYSKYASRLSKHQCITLPEIRLFGKWLQETGFHNGQTIIVRHEKNRIVIVPSDERR